MIGETISHYRIIAKLGEGGMGEVYQAEDTKLDRSVALKFLPAELTRNPEAKARFVQEARAASALDHPNICTIYEVDETNEGRLFIAMACYEGETLKERIARGPLPLDETFDIARQVAGGLAKAHERDIVHRDIKPANIFITHDGLVKILDFGVAKLKGLAQMTRTGTTLGTAAYMSPEQARGEDVDHRTDIWSLGVVLYEMVTGRRPFQGDYEQAVVYSILNTEPNAPSQLRKDIPRIIENITIKTLQKNREDRYENLQELLADLKAPSNKISTKDEEEKSIIVLPFVNMSSDPEQEYFSDGLTEEIITDLSHIHDLLVISRSSAVTFKGTKKKLKEIAREVNVQYVLEGSVRKAGNDIRITAQLIEATNDAYLWAEKYSGTLDDVFDIQERVSSSIVNALRLKLTADEKERIAARPIDNTAAYDLYLRAYQEFWQFNEGALERALRYLQNATGLISDNDVIYSAMAMIYSQFVNIGLKHEDYIAKSEEYAQMALAINPGSSKIHHVMGFNSLVFYGNPAKAVHHLKRAVMTEPSLPGPLISLIAAYCYCGKIDAAVPLVDTLRKINPLSPQRYYFEGFLRFYDGKYNLALEPLRKSYQMEPANPIFYFYYAWTLAYCKKHDEALSVIDEHIDADSDIYLSRSAHLLKSTLLNDRDAASGIITNDFLQSTKRRGVFSHLVATMLAHLSERDRALDLLENAVDLGFFNYPLLSAKDPWLESISTDARFKELIRRVKYKWENFEV